MPRPNRTDRRLHFLIELFKLLWLSAAAVIGGLVTLMLTAQGGFLMTLTVMAGLTLVIGAALALWAVVYTIRKLPDES